MQITISYTDLHETEVIENVDRILAASEAFSYWTFWYPEDTDGKTRVRFIPERRVSEVELLGEEDGQDGPKLASVTPINKGK